ncbi:hypothetical protein HMPREF0083_03559 [Aneurinibacillus aneurinilyticus ATCC 12856]|uniref:Uncharacterized protein n=1 Tax=Aneurinibacillus aneurinilyticus ATCC 12856 TaxID=649747 RepID=U1Y815_ANEAE|nr:hypothetical protein HMPREF0083_03559 [Aneurinibacillus aneurinilyticus ATCC 12856]
MPMYPNNMLLGNYTQLFEMFQPKKIQIKIKVKNSIYVLPMPLIG